MSEESARFSVCKLLINGTQCNEPFESRKAVKRHLHEFHHIKMSRTYRKYECSKRMFIPPKEKVSATTAMKGGIETFRNMMAGLFHSK